MTLTRAVLLTLVVGAGLGLLMRQLLKSRTHLGWAESVIAGLVGSVLGIGLVTRLSGDRLVQDGVAVLAAVGGTLAAILLLTAVTRPKERSAAEIAAGGESAQTEFKSTARYNLHSKQRDEKIEAVIAKTVAALANTDGGVLLIGVADDGTVLGLDYDYKFMKQPDTDRFELWLRDHLSTTLGAAPTSSLQVEFPVLEGHDVCLVRVPRSPRPVFVRTAKNAPVEMWVRIGNSTRQLAVDDALSFAADRWGRRRLR